MNEDLEEVITVYCVNTEEGNMVFECWEDAVLCATEEVRNTGEGVYISENKMTRGELYALPEY